MKLNILIAWDATAENGMSVDDYANEGGRELFTKMHCVRISNQSLSRVSYEFHDDLHVHFYSGNN